MSKAEYVMLPRSVLGAVKSVVLRGIYVSLLEKADKNGQLTISVRSFADELGVSYQTMRTALSKFVANAVINATSNANLTQSLTQRLTHITICDISSCDTSLHKEQRTKQRKFNAASNARSNATEVVVPDYISPPFVAPEFAEIWHRFIEYRKEIKKPYKSAASEKTAYNKMVEMANNNPATAKDMVERTILGQWQGLYPSDDGKRTKQTARVNAPLSDAEKLADYEDLAHEISKRINSRKG